MSAPKQMTEEQKLKLKQKEERRLAFEAKRSEQCKGQDKDDGDTNKSKADMKRERREKQEAQRAAKEQSKLEVISKKSEVKTIDKAVASESNTGDSNKKVRNPASTSRSKAKSNKNSDQQCSDHQKANRQGELFPDIPKREIDPSVLTESIGYSGIHLHPDIVRVGLQMNANRIVDSTSRCLATLCALKSVIDHHDVVAGSATKSMLHDLKLRFDVITEFLTRCRPLNVSLRNVLRIVRTQLSRVSGELTVDQAKQSLIDLIDRFIHEEIECGLDGIKEHGSQKIHDGDVILVFNNSFLVRHVLGQALSDGKQFKVIVVDANPRREGRKMLQYLVNLGVDTTYVLINAVAHVMKGVSKVLLEANTLLANGYMMADLGSSQIALIARASNKPVLICCETYKFSERVHTDSFVFNEAAPLDEFFNPILEPVKSADLKLYMDSFAVSSSSKSVKVNILNLYDDVTPPDFISLVITEMGFLPCTAVPAIIRRNIIKFQLEN